MGTTSGMTSRDQSNNRVRKILTPLLSALITYLIYALVCRRLQVMPFYPGGEKTLVWADAFYQYLDFFGWYKNILAGRQSLWYTFSSSLGQNAAGLFSYYLASPFNLLLVFFPKTGLQAFFNITASLKLAASSCTMSVYLQERLAKLRPFYVLLLSLCYGLMQYNFSQASNLMWIDGVYMLPLILLGVYRAVHKKKAGRPGLQHSLRSRPGDRDRDLQGQKPAQDHGCRVLRLKSQNLPQINGSAEGRKPRRPLCQQGKGVHRDPGKSR